MVVVLISGPHAHEHFKIGEDELEDGELPRYIRVQTSMKAGRLGEISVYQRAGELSDGTKSYHFAYKQAGRIDGLVQFGDETLSRKSMYS